MMEGGRGWYSTKCVMSTPAPRQLRPRVRDEWSGETRAQVAPLLGPDEWYALENETGVCFAVATLEVLLRCPPLWRFFEMGYRPRTECLFKLRLLYHALRRNHGATADLVHAFLSQEAFAEFTTEEYARASSGEVPKDGRHPITTSNPTKFLAAIIRACEDDVGDGMFRHTEDTDPSMYRVFDDYTLTFVPRRPLGYAPEIVALAHAGIESKEGLPVVAQRILGMTYDWIGSVIYHPMHEGDWAHVTAIVDTTPPPGQRRDFRIVDGLDRRLHPRAHVPAPHRFDPAGKNRYYLSLYARRIPPEEPSPYARVVSRLAGRPLSIPQEPRPKSLHLSTFLWEYARELVWQFRAAAKCGAGHVVQWAQRIAVLPLDLSQGTLAEVDVSKRIAPPGALPCPQCHGSFVAHIDPTRVVTLEAPRVALVASTVAVHTPPLELVLSRRRYRLAGLVWAETGPVYFATELQLGVPKEAIHFFVYRAHEAA